MSRSFLLWLVLFACLFPTIAIGAPITLSGTVTYDGPYNADTLYVAVNDTGGLGNVHVSSVLVFDIGDSPVSQPYTFNLESSTPPAYVWIFAILDVEGGQPIIMTADVVGWYGSSPVAAVLSTATSLSGLDFALPTGEIRGSVTFVPDQDGATIFAPPFSLCEGGWGLIRPSIPVVTSGPYALLGLYAGSYCLKAFGSGTGTVPSLVCYGDFTCASPTEVVVGDGEIVNGVNISFFDPTPAQQITWGRLKTRYP